jgi:hypothetical protein
MRRPEVRDKVIVISIPDNGFIPHGTISCLKEYKHGQWWIDGNDISGKYSEYCIGKKVMNIKEYNDEKVEVDKDQYIAILL